MQAEATRASEAERRRRRREAALASKRRQLALGAIVSAAVIGLTYGLPGASWSRWAQALLATPAYLWVGSSFHRAALRNARHRAVNMDTLVSLGTSVAYFYSLAALLLLPGRPLFFDISASVVTLIGLGKYLEMLAKAKAAASIEALAGLEADVAHLVARGKAKVGGEASSAIDVPTAALRPGDTIVVLPGERFPVDGEVSAGQGYVDESALTGEPMPVAKLPASTVSSGSVNGSSALTCRVLRPGSESTLARVIAAVEAAQDDKSAAQRMADKVSSVFVPAILALSAITFAAWYSSGHGPIAALVPAVAVLVVACPCALGLATPVAVMVGAGRGAEHGLLLRGGESLERVHGLTTVVVDKTGTLTLGKPEVTQMAAIGGSTLADELRRAAAVEAQSEHPLARAILAAAQAHGANRGELGASGVRASVGGGVSGTVAGEEVLVGSIAWLKERDIDSTVAREEIEEMEAAARTVVGVARGGLLRLVLGISDPLRADARTAVARLAARGLQVVLATGDGAATAQRVAEELGISQVHASLSPMGKAGLVAQLRSEGRRVAMVGDGINDAPALAAADVGIALGGGAGAAAAAADITLVSGDIGAVADALGLAEAIRRVIRQNLGWAFGYNILLIPLAAFGVLPPILAAVAMALSSLSVVLNALRLRKITY